MNKININKGRNLMKTMAAVVLVGMSTAGCVDMDLSPNGKPAEGNVWYLAVPDEKHPACMARRLDRMRHHEDRLPAVVDRREQSQHLIR